MMRERSRRGGVLRNLRRLLVLALAITLAWGGGLVWFAGGIPREEGAGGNTDRSTDAIVVLTGGSHRLATGLRLLEEGLGRKLFVSGVYDGVDVQELLRVVRQTPGHLECCIVLGYAADSTLGNASETAGWMREQGYRSLRLVTANYHMRRSLLEFHMAMPDIEVVPHPVAPPNVRLEDWWLRPGTASLIVSEYNKYLVVLLRSFLEDSRQS